jgi:hypothetical protein
MEELYALARCAGLVAVPPPREEPLDRRRCILENGMYVHPDTGLLLGRHLELDMNKGPYAPIYHYNRSCRFIGLFFMFHIDIRQQGECLRMFEAIEKVWEDTKAKYTRVYFLTQKLCLQEITNRLGIPSSQPEERPISDIRRYRAQIKIFEDLWKIVICNKCHSPASNCTLGTNRAFLSLPQTANSP